VSNEPAAAAADSDTHRSIAAAGPLDTAALRSARGLTEHLRCQHDYVNRLTSAAQVLTHLVTISHHTGSSSVHLRFAAGRLAPISDSERSFHAILPTDRSLLALQRFCMCKEGLVSSRAKLAREGSRPGLKGKSDLSDLSIEAPLSPKNAQAPILTLSKILTDWVTAACFRDTEPQRATTSAQATNGGDRLCTTAEYPR